MSFNKILDKYRKISFSEKDKGERFERLIKAYLLTDPKYAYFLQKVWLWSEFPYKHDLGFVDTGIDLVALTNDGQYWAIQCKCYKEGTIIDKKAIDTFFTTSGRNFKDENSINHTFSYRLWIDTTGKPFSSNANDAFNNQNIPAGRLGLHDLQDAPLDWEKLDNGITGDAARLVKKELREHQSDALNLTNQHFKSHDRGKLIMACGTGKTFTSLRIAENETNNKGLILFLIPSIALLGQTLKEWFFEANKPINAICICSDPEISKDKKKVDDIDTTSVVDLAYPASTNVDSILKQFEYLKTKSNDGLTVVFSTYQSIEVIARAQKELSKYQPEYSEFDIIICDEAHRTTGVTLKDEVESTFVKVHNNDFIKAKKRLYMTATPRLYDVPTKSKAAQAEAVLWSMDNEEHYGKEIFKIGFGEAVSKGLLTDYKVLILTLNENDVPPAVQKALSTVDGKISIDDPSKLIGCINALSKQILGDEGIIKDSDPEPMRRAVAFCQNIDISKKTTEAFSLVSDAYVSELPVEERSKIQSITSMHIDGSMNANDRGVLLDWLKADNEENECKILTNVRCLSEGVDVPSLDAVLFLTPRNSQVDVVQSVGRVMRKSPGKKYGYIIIPIVVPSDIEADVALDNNKEYKIVWDVLNALRAHDDRFEATVNQIELNKNKPKQILVGGSAYTFDENGNAIRKSDGYSDGDSSESKKEIARQLSIQFHQLQTVVFGKMAKKVGDRKYWEQWAKSVADIATRQIERITNLVNDNGVHQKAFNSFLKGLHQNINPSITQEEAIEMLSQHIITKPVFDALFEDYSFVKNNPMSQSMQKMLDILEDDSIDTDTETLQKFYESVRLRASGIDNAEGKQRIIIELYDKFFKTAFPKMVEKLGIVYSPVEVVDFIIHSVADILKKEFNRDISDENVHILDPFTGTGTFITRLLQSGVINSRDLARKYTQEIHCNEIVLLAYYIAAVNIENAFHDLQPETNTTYIPFDGICLTDTFQLGETPEGEKLFSEMFPQNSKRVQRQQKVPLKIIIGNPPYSVGQTSANDNAQNQSYPNLNQRIADTYADLTNATNKNSLYDSYIKAFRWSTDRLDKNGGIISFVSNGAWLDGNSADGFRKSLEKEFTSIYVFNLRGNARTQGELRQKEAGNVFGSGSRTPISITLLVKNPNVKSEKATIHYHNIGDYLSQNEKLKIISDFKSFDSEKMQLQTLSPNEQGDWINHRNDIFSTFIPLVGEYKMNIKTESFFIANSNGLKSGRDAWVYNYSKNTTLKNIDNMLIFFKNQKEKYKSKIKENPKLKIEEIIEFNPLKISWDEGLIDAVKKNKEIFINQQKLTYAIYRPFSKSSLYLDKSLIQRTYQIPKLFPTSKLSNLVINVPGAGDTKAFSCLISNNLPDLGFIGASQCFPLFYYEENIKKQTGLFNGENNSDFIRHDSISNFIFERVKKQYGKNVAKEDIFYYVYGFLHSTEYRETFANDLKKMLPRLPLVENVNHFWEFSKAGRNLAELHLNYETVAPFAGAIVSGDDGKSYTVDKLRFPKKNQKDTIIYNSKIVISNIPEKAYEYVVNGKSAIEWIMERYQVSTHKESGIVNNPNDWATEVGNPRYILDLLLSIINVSVQTVDIVNSLPKLNFNEVAVENE